MADVQPRAGGVGKHVENVKFRRQFGSGGFLSSQPVALGKRVSGRDGFPRVESAKSLLLIPELLPFGLNQMKRILSAAAGHRRMILRKAARRGNGGIERPPRLMAPLPGRHDIYPRFNSHLRDLNSGNYNVTPF
jgi:hypothetical protein